MEFNKKRILSSADNLKSIVIVCKWAPPDPAPIGYMMQELGGHLEQAGWEVSYCDDRSKIMCYIDKAHLINFLPKRFQKAFDHLIFSVVSFFTIVFGRKRDVIFCVSQPMSQFFTVGLAGKIRRSTVVFNIQDLHPDALFDLGIIKNNLIKSILIKLERFGYCIADGLFVISGGFARHCEDRGASHNKIRIIPNWIDLNEIDPRTPKIEYAMELGVNLDRPIILFAGSLSLSACPLSIVECAAILRDRGCNAQFVIVGDGSMKGRCIAMAQEKKIDNIKFLPFQPRSFLADLQALSTVSIITMRRGQGKNSVPSKMYGYMSAARPIIACVDKDSETANIIFQAKCGWVVEPEDPFALAEAILIALNKADELAVYGKNGRLYLERFNNAETVLNNYQSALSSLLSK